MRSVPLHLQILSPQSEWVNVIPNFIKGMLSLVLVLFATVSITLLMSGQLPSRLENYHLNDCVLPCWIGIIPGKTTIGEAYLLIKSKFQESDYEYFLVHSPYLDGDWFTVKYRQDGTFLSVSFNKEASAADHTPDTIISQITITTGPATNLALGDWYRSLGKPQALSITWGDHWAAPNVLYYERGVRLTLSNGFDQFTLSSPYSSAGILDIYDQINRAYPPNFAVLWHGWNTPYKDELLALMQP